MSTRQTGRHLKVSQIGSDAQGVTLEGNPLKPEHATFLVFFPGGVVEITRTADNNYWVHISENKPDTSSGGRAEAGQKVGRIVECNVANTSIGTEDLTPENLSDQDNWIVSVKVSTKAELQRVLPKRFTGRKSKPSTTI